MRWLTHRRCLLFLPATTLVFLYAAVSFALATHGFIIPRESQGRLMLASDMSFCIAAVAGGLAIVATFRVMRRYIPDAPWLARWFASIVMLPAWVWGGFLLLGMAPFVTAPLNWAVSFGVSAML